MRTGVEADFIIVNDIVDLDSVVYHIYKDFLPQEPEQDSLRWSVVAGTKGMGPAMSVISETGTMMTTTWSKSGLLYRGKRERVRANPEKAQLARTGNPQVCRLQSGLSFT